MLIRFCETLLEKIRESQMPIAERLTSGFCKDYEEYKLLVGKLEGLKMAEDMVVELNDVIFKTRRIDEIEKGVMDNDDEQVKFY